MTRDQLEHVVRAAAYIVDDDELIVVGSQSILGQYPDAPPALLKSNEADVYPKNKPELADVIDGTIGELSPFHETFGYYAHGVGPTTAVLPSGWLMRLIPVSNANTRGATAWCLEIHDLIISKLVAGREKDLEFAQEAARHQLVNPELLVQLLEATDISEDLRAIAEARIRRLPNFHKDERPSLSDDAPGAGQ